MICWQQELGEIAYECVILCKCVGWQGEKGLNNPKLKQITL